jgi:hypothetical protein
VQGCGYPIQIIAYPPPAMPDHEKQNTKKIRLQNFVKDVSSACSIVSPVVVGWF